MILKEFILNVLLIYKWEKKMRFTTKLTVLSMLVLTGCASQENKKQEVNKVPPVAPIVIKNTNWQDWSLVIVSLDKNQKPSEKTEFSLIKPMKISKPKAPEISIEELPSSEGRLIRIKCDDNVASQKFDTTEQLKGWAIQMGCYKQTYYFIVNENSKKMQ